MHHDRIYGAECEIAQNLAHDDLGRAPYLVQKCRAWIKWGLLAANPNQLFDKNDRGSICQLILIFFCPLGPNERENETLKIVVHFSFF